MSSPAKPAEPIDLFRQNFKVGRDRLYGLNSERKRVQDHLERRHRDPYSTSDVTIDRVNNRLGLSLRLHSDKPLSAHQPLSTAHGTDQAFHAFLTSQEAPPGKTFTGRNKDDAIRRASKLGIDFSARQGGKVHFLLGGLEHSMEDVVNKRNFNKHHGVKDFTAAELRYIYRNKKHLRESVQFYDRGLQPTAAPWETHPKLWEQYKRGETVHTWPRAPKAPSSSSSLPARPALPLGSPEVSPHASPQVSPFGSPQVSPFGSPRSSPHASPQVSPLGSPRSSPHASPQVSPPGTPVHRLGPALDPHAVFAQLSQLAARQAPPQPSAPLPALPSLPARRAANTSAALHMRALDLAVPSRPAWNASTRVSQPLSATATRTTTRSAPTPLTGKIGSKHWP